VGPSWLRSLPLVAHCDNEWTTGETIGCRRKRQRRSAGRSAAAWLPRGTKQQLRAARPACRLSTERGSGRSRCSAATAHAAGRGAIMAPVMDDDPLPVRPQAVVAAYLLAALCLLIPLAVVGSTFAGIVLWRRKLRPHAAAVVGFGIACMVFGVTALR
jgi:hypothetical protein